MTRILAIDPGSEVSAWLLLVDGRPIRWAKEPNEQVRNWLRWEWQGADDDGAPGKECVDLVVIETIEPRGERLWRQTVEMLQWAGRFAEAARPLPVAWLSREAIKRHLCPAPGHRGAANDADVWAALCERFGGEPAVAVGRKAAPGPLHGIHSDMRQALAVAVAWQDGAR